MRKLPLGIAWLFTIISIVSCSKDDSTASDIPPVAKDTDLLTTANVKTYMVDPNATAETVALFYNLKKLAKLKFAIGQQDAFNSFYNNGSSALSDIKKTTGYDPALLGLDFSFITDKNNNGQASNWFYQQEVIITDDAKEAYNKGMIISFSWHLREPNNEESFYTSEMSDTEKATAFKSILPGGINNAWYKKKLDKIASIVSNLKGSNGELIPIIFRPFHEFDGNWFWWGANFCTANEYKAAYQFTVEYLRDTKGVHNILYAFSPDNSYSTSTNYLSRYPGDAYVDILGMDNYGDFNNKGEVGVKTANAKLKILSDLAKEKNKIAALTETGYQITFTNKPIDNFFSNLIYKAVTEQNIEIAYVMFWTNSQQAYFVPPPNMPDTADFIEFSKKPKALLSDKLSNLYKLI